MKSSINIPLYTFLLFPLMLLGPSTSNATNKQDESLIRRQYSNVTNISHRDWNLSATRGKTWALTFKKDNHDLTIYKKNGKVVYEMTLRQGEKMYEVYAKEKKVGVIVKSREVMFNESACANTIDAFQIFKSDDFKLKIEDVAYSDDFFGGTCSKLSPDSKANLQSIMARQLSPESSFLLKCLSSESFTKNANQKDDLQVTANKLITRYVDELTKIQNGQSQLKVECSEGETAKYDPKRSALIFPVKDSKLAKDGCKSDGQVFGHEFLHHVGLSEQETKAIDDQCADQPGAGKSCKKVVLSKNKSEGTAATAALIAAQKKEVVASQKAIAPVLVAEIKTAQFVPVQDADIQEISNPTSTATYEASVERVHKAMSTNLEYMAAPLNRAIASTVSTARAETASGTTTRESISKTTSAKSRLPASTKANATDNEEYVVEEILADKYNVPVETIRAASVATPTTAAPATVATRIAAPKTTRAPGETAGNNAAPGGGEIAAGNSGGAAASLSGGGGVAGRSVSSGSAGGARSNSRLPASAVGNDPLIEQLGQFNEVRGTKYRQIQERYDDPAFEPELKAKNIAIEYRQNNKTTTIGDTSDKRTLFRDDGTVLKKVTGAR